MTFYKGKRIKPKQLAKIYRSKGLCDHGAVPGNCNRCKIPSKTIESKVDYGQTIFQQNEQWKEDSKNREGSLGKSKPIYNRAAWIEEKNRNEWH
jgi:hypothetical protein